MKVKVAVVGLGKMGLLHASILNVLDDVKLAAVCEKSPLIRRFSKRIIPGIAVVADVKELSGAGLDAVYVTTPAPSHFPITKAIYTGGIAQNVFVEKPLASSYIEAEELCNLAISQSSITMVGYNRRFSVTFRKAKQILDEGVLGKPYFFEWYAYSSDFLGGKAESKTTSRGGILSDLGCHVVDLALWFFGQLEVESAEVESLIDAYSEDSVYFSVSTLGGLKGEFRCSWCKENYRMPDIGLVVKASNGTLKVDEDKVELKLIDGSSLLWYKHDLGDAVPFFIGGTDYLREDKFFISSIIDGCNAEPSFYTASKVEEVIDQVKKSGTGCRAR
ncbi:MAG: Gfo/Idh/MocA family oxidoreductase [Chloroflexota bacterium]|nr:Gfo/Idh/MocA family oxidoreductase [Chloroflexota bacterium]